MASMTSAVYKQIKIAMDVIRTSVDALSSSDANGDFYIDVDETRELLERMIDELSNITLTPFLVRLKRRLNGLVTINKLPVEIFTHILLLTSPAPEEEDQHSYPYVPYTWVCHRWRSLLVQNPAFWTLIRLRPIIAWNQHIEPFYHELFRRSKSSGLDVILLCNSLPFKSMLEGLFDNDSGRIRRLHLSNEHRELTRLVLSGRHFPSLERFTLTDRLTISHQSRSLSRLLPILIASHHLETFECTLDESDWGDIQKDQISLILNRIRNLNLTVYSPAVAQSVLDLLHNNAKLQSLQFITDFRKTENDFSGQAVFPELEFLSTNDASLMEHIRAPKLSSLDATWTSAPDTLDYPILDEFDFSSIKYLYIRDNCRRHNAEGGYCILGTKERDIQCRTLFSAKAGGDIFSRTYPTDCFHLKFRKEGAFDIALRTALSSIIPRLTNLVELHLLSPHIFPIFREIIPRIPSIQKLIVQSSNGLRFFLLNHPFECHTMPVLPNDMEMYADEGIAHRNVLKCIGLRNCPPLSDVWLQELRELGIEVVTEKDAEDVVVKSRDMNIEKWTHL